MLNDKLINRSFGKLNVISEGPSTNLGVKRWICRCSCGNIILVTKYNLIHGLSKSCGCLNREHNLTGKFFGCLKVLSRAKNKNKKKCWLCKCSCGSEIVVKANHLKTGNTKSCGCLKKRNDKKNLHLERKITSYENLIKTFFLRYKKGALCRKLTFTLTLEDFSCLIQKNCFYCGNKPLNLIKSTDFELKYNGIDRVDNNKGYLKENCITCCPLCNLAKKNHSLIVFKEWALKLGDNITKSIYLSKFIKQK